MMMPQIAVVMRQPTGSVWSEYLHADRNDPLAGGGGRGSAWRRARICCPRRRRRQKLSGPRLVERCEQGPVSFT